MQEMLTKIKSIILILLVFILFSSFGINNYQNSESFYFFLSIDRNLTKSGKGYMSELVFYPGYNECNKLSDVYFILKSKGIFEDYIKAKYKDDFSNLYEINNAVKSISKKRNSYDRLTSLSSAQERVFQWTKDEQKGSFIQTKCSISCKD